MTEAQIEKGYSNWLSETETNANRAEAFSAGVQWAILQAAIRDTSIPTADQIYAELKGVALTRTSPENICDVLAVIKRLHIAASAPTTRS